MTPTVHRFRVPSTLAGKRLDVVLESLVEGHSRAQLQKLVRKGRVRVEGKRVLRSNVNVPGKAELSIELDAEAPPPETVRVLHEDRELIVVDKPAGLLTHAADRSTAASLVCELERRLGPLPTLLGEERPGIVHRLDRETSGVLVVARTERAMRRLNESFRAREVQKVYLALVSHVPPPGAFVVDERLGPVPGKSDRQMCRPPIGGKDSLTTIELLDAFEQHALLSCRPRTGRRHQIRVHLAEAGYPVLGDELYGTRRREALPEGVPRPPRLALHAWRLGFRHPTNGERLRFEAPFPADLTATRNGLRRE